MKGIQFIVAVLIDLTKNAEVWEDSYDALIAQDRADEPRESLEEVRTRLFA